MQKISSARGKDGADAPLQLRTAVCVKNTSVGNLR
jgi:hypothetical protein